MSASQIHVPVSTGELFDKISILEIKSERLIDADKIENVRHEMRLLKTILFQLKLSSSAEFEQLCVELKAVNTKIWDVEDTIRDLERRAKFDGEFVNVARSVYRLNDERARVKRCLSLLTGSAVIEEKSYAAY